MLRKCRQERRKFSVAGVKRAALAGNSHDFRRTFEGTEHQNSAPILFPVAEGLDPSAGQAQVGGLLGTPNAKSLESLGRIVDVAVRVEWRRSDKKRPATIR